MKGRKHSKTSIVNSHARSKTVKYENQSTEINTSNTSHSPSILEETKELEVQNTLKQNPPFLTVKRLKTDKKIKNPL